MVAKRLKVVWICHFSNSAIRAKLPLSSGVRYVDFAPWIIHLISGFEKRADIDLHIIAFHPGMKRLQYSFIDNGISYYFINPDMPFFNRRWPHFFPVDKWTNFIQSRFLVRRIINKIKPDLINLHGAENDHYSSTVLGLKKIPVYVCIQGIYSNPERFGENSKQDKYKIKTERRVHKECRYFGIFPPFFAHLIKRDNENPVLLHQTYVIATDLKAEPYNGPKKYDFVFFARITPVKGIDRIIEALSLIKRVKEDVTFNIIGGSSADYLSYLKEKAKKLELTGNITFTGQLPTLEDVYREVQASRVSVISSKFENLPGTIIESVFLGIPVTATSVGRIPYLNRDGETILLSEYGDVAGLAKNMLTLLNNPAFANELTQKCKDFIVREFSCDSTINRYMYQYHAIIENFRNGTPIPEHLLFRN